MGTALGRLSGFGSTRAGLSVYRTRDQAQGADPAKQPTVGWGRGYHVTSLFLCVLLLKVSDKALCAVRAEQREPLSVVFP